MKHSFEEKMDLREIPVHTFVGLIVFGIIITVIVEIYNYFFRPKKKALRHDLKDNELRRILK